MGTRGYRRCSVDGVDGARRAAGALGWSRILLAVVVVLAGQVLAGRRAAEAQVAQAPARVRLVRQTSWVAPGETLSLALRTADIADPGALELAVTVHPAVRTRAELGRTLVGEGLAAPLGPRSGAAVPLPQVALNVDGTLSMQVVTQDPADPPDPARVRLRGPGIYPVLVELRELGGGDTVDRFTTHVLAVAAPATGGRLGAAVVLSLSAPPSTGLAGVPIRPPAGAAALAEAAAGFRAGAPVPVTVAPTPEVLESLATSDPATAAALKEGLASRDVLSRPYVPVDVPGLGAAAAALLPQQLATGREAVRTVLGRAPVEGVWLADEPLDGPALAQVVAAGTPRLVLPAGALEGSATQPAPVQPVAVTASPAPGTAAALVADRALASRLDGRVAPLDQPLLAHHVLADLAAMATLPADQGAPPPEGSLDRRVVTVLASRAFTPTSGFLTELLGGLAASPVLQPLDLASAFALPAEPALGVPASPRPAAGRTTTTRARRGTTTTAAAPVPRGRALAALPPGAADQRIGDVAAEAAWQLATHEQVLTGTAAIEGADPSRDDPTPGPGVLRRRLLVATSADLGVEQRRARLQALSQRARDDLGALKMPEARSLRLTARTGQLPVGIFNETGRTARVLLQLESEKLDFPEGNSTQVVLDRQTTTSRILVRVRASGSFPVKVRLLTPDGGRVLQETEYVVRANTVPGVAIAVSGAAALVLIGWWAKTLMPRRRHLRRRRSSRQPG